MATAAPDEKMFKIFKSLSAGQLVHNDLTVNINFYKVPIVTDC